MPETGPSKRGARVRELAADVDREIAKLPGVRKTDKGSFRIGAKVFVRNSMEADAVVYGFKLGHAAAKDACAKHDFVRPMKFGGMGAKGWVEALLRRRRDVAPLLGLLHASRDLYPPSHNAR